MPPSLPTKVCAACARTFSWRKKWERDWQDVRYCSRACRARGRADPGDARMEAAILRLLAARAPHASICPSEAARIIDPDRWQERMEDVRRAARRLAARGVVEITQGGRPIDAAAARGAVRIRRAPGFSRLRCPSVPAATQRSR